MKRYFFSFLFLSILVTTNAQQDAETLRETAKTLMQQGDYDNALNALNKALGMQPGDFDVLKDRDFVYYLQKDFGNAIKAGNDLVHRTDADADCYQLLGLSLRATAEYKEGDKMYKEGIAKFPNSGVLYNDYGEMLVDEKMPAIAIKQWEAGIEGDPNYSSNYYNAAKYYDAKGNIIWALLYEEIFINIESLSTRTAEIKELLLTDYKKLFLTDALDNSLQKGGAFEKAVASIYNKNKNITNSILNPETLTELRTRFILSWYETDAAQFPFHLFDFQRMLLQKGMFEAYNQWVFGETINSANFDAWQKTHAGDMAMFQHYKQNVLYKSPKGEYYPH
jgi:tetratricopeptide (TPR) repeat protein